MAKTKDALRILDSLTGDDRELRAMIDEETSNSEVSRLVYGARTQAGLTQAELARLIGSRQSQIARLESADYEGHSLSMLCRIAKALDKRVELRFVAARKTRKAVRKTSKKKTRQPA